jgi:hypothetical protein
LDGTTDYGYLIVNVRTARGAVPVEGAAVTVTDLNGGGGSVIYASKTDRAGSTVRIRLPVKKNGSSENMCAFYNIDADMEGYTPVRCAWVQIYPGVTSVLPVSLVPAVPGYSAGAVYIDCGATPES